MRGMKKCFFTVSYGAGSATRRPRVMEVARFSSYPHAMQFAWDRSGDDGWAEVRHSTGLVGQYLNGSPTPEFAQHHRDVFGDTQADAMVA